MKFLPKSVTHRGARIGKLTEFERIPDVVFETPILFLYTKAGAVPHLTKDVLRMLTSEQHLLSVSLPSTFLMADAVKDVNIPFANFVSMKEHLHFLSPQDPAYATKPGFQTNESVSVWTRTGRQVLTANKYMDTVETFKPDLYVTLSDADTDIDSSKKHVTKSVSRSISLLNKCLERHNVSTSLKGKVILASIVGGYNLNARTYFIEHVKDKPVAGYVIDGLHKNGPDTQNISMEQIKDIVEHSINLLPSDKLRVSMGCWNPITVLGLVELGIDAFDSSYPYTATEDSQVLTFMCDHVPCDNDKHVILISEERYKDDFSPICHNCTCLTCKNHSRAYLHHLHHTKELLGKVLLMIHNTHHYIQFFDQIRENLKNNKFEQFQEKIKAKFPSDFLSKVV